MVKSRLRFNVFSRKFIQFKYLMIIILAMVVPALVVGSFLYYFIFTITADQIGMPEAVASTLIPVVQRINYIMFIGLLPLGVLFFIWGVILSHRFCGPLERIEADLDKLLEGNYSVRFKVRKNDDIHSIVAKLNKLLDNLSKKK